MDFYNTTFYDNASAEYSGKRYKGKTNSYIQFFFKRRLQLILNILKNNISDKKNLRLLEIGCADGIVVDTVVSNFSNSFSECVGTDISPEMIEMAKKKNNNKNISYYLKNNGESGLFDVVLAVGFLSPGIFDQEFSYINKYLKPEGTVIVSLASKDSLYTKIKLRDKDYAKDYWNHRQYEDFLRRDFDLISTHPYGLFIPKLWAFPSVARIIQPTIETLLAPFLSGFFHEKLYVLRKRS